MWNEKKKIKQIMTCLAIILLVVVGISRIRIQSVGSYQKEQRQVAQEHGLEEGNQETLPDSSVTELSGLTDEKKQKENQNEDGNEADKKKENENPSSKEEKTDAKEEKDGKSQSDKGKGTQASGKKGQNSSTSKAEKEVKVTPSGGGSAGSSDENSSSTGADRDAGSTGGSETNQSESTVSDSEKNVVATPVQEKIVCSVQIRCDRLFENKDKIDSSMWKYIPTDGKILPETKITVDKGTSAYGALNQICKAKSIALDAEYTALYNNYYVKGIGYLYEKQAGDRSGWIYKINGTTPNKGASSFILSDGDSLTYAYTCDGKTS